MWATQISHLAKDVDFDKERDWASLQASHTPLCYSDSYHTTFWSAVDALQLNGTRNVEQSFFKDWFLGHLNFQIEHQ